MADKVMFTTIRLGDVCEKIGSGATPRGGRGVYLSDGISLIRSQNIYNDHFQQEGLAYISDEHADELANVTVQAGDVLLNITGDSVARCCHVPANVLPARVNQHVAIIRPNPSKLNPRYLMYYLVNPSMQQYMLTLAGAGATRNALTKGMIEDFNVPSPPLSVQNAIARILGTLDDKIELNRRMNETLEAMARVIFESWFVDFDPVRAKTEGRDPGLPKEIADLFPNSFQTTDFGDIPTGWNTKTLGDVTQKITKGTTPTTLGYRFVERGVNFIKAESITEEGYFLTGSFAFIDKETHAALARSILQEGDILFTIAGTIGRIARVPASILPANTNQAVAIIRPDCTKIEPLFLLYWLSQARSQRSLGTRVVHAVQANLSLSELSRTTLVFPTRSVLSRLFDHFRTLRIKVDANVNESRNLAALRDALLPKLISGEIRVTDTDRFVGSFA
jgi:type I restriction enzyme S subunit